MKVLKTSLVLKLLLDDGWEIVHQRGSHRQLKLICYTPYITIYKIILLWDFLSKMLL